MKNDYEKINAAIDYMEKRIEDRKLGVPLTLEAAEAGAQVTFLNNAELPVYYALNGGERIAIPSGSEKSVTLEAAGDTIAFLATTKAMSATFGTATNAKPVTATLLVPLLAIFTETL